MGGPEARAALFTLFFAFFYYRVTSVANFMRIHRAGKSTVLLVGYGGCCNICGTVPTNVAAECTAEILNDSAAAEFMRSRARSYIRLHFCLCNRGVSSKRPSGLNRSRAGW